MTQKFINAWCEEHGFSMKVGAIIALEGLKEKDLKEDNFGENGDSIEGMEDTYTVYDEEDVRNMIDDREYDVKSDIKGQLSKIDNSEIKDYIKWDEYFEDFPIEVEDILGDSFTETSFCGYTFYIASESDEIFS